jgi:hypothetical protein
MERHTMKRALFFISAVSLFSMSVHGQAELELRSEIGIGYWIHRMLSDHEIVEYEHTRHSLSTGLGIGYYFGREWKIGPRLGYWVLFDTYMIGPNDNEFVSDRYAVGDPYFGGALIALHLEKQFGTGNNKALFYAEPGHFWLNSIHPQNDAFKNRFQWELGGCMLFPRGTFDKGHWELGISYRQSMFREEGSMNGDRHTIYFFGLQFGYRW